MEDALQVRLQGHPGRDLSLVADLEYGLMVAHGKERIGGEHLHVLIEAAGIVAHAHIGERDARGIVGTPWDRALIGQTGIGIEIDQIAVVRRAGTDPGEPRQRAGDGAVGDRIDTPIALVVERRTVRQRTCQRDPLRVEALILEMRDGCCANIRPWSGAR